MKVLEKYIQKAENRENQINNENRLTELLGDSASVYLEKGKDLFIKTFTESIKMGAPEEGAIKLAKKAVSRSGLLNKDELKLVIFKNVEKCLKMIKG
jgi:hypothetical protein